MGSHRRLLVIYHVTPHWHFASPQRLRCAVTLAVLRYAIIGVLMFVFRLTNISRFCFIMSRWMLLPCASNAGPLSSQAELEASFLTSDKKAHRPSQIQQYLFLSGQWDAEFQFSSATSSRLAWCLFAAPLCSVVHAAAACVCWILPVLLPMSTVNVFLLKSLWDFKVPVSAPVRLRAYLLHLRFGNAVHLLHSVFGVNIIMLNLSALTIPLIVRGYMPGSHKWFHNKVNCTIYFVFGFLAVIPLGNFIHVSLYRLCSKTKPIYGFVANAVCHAVIEISVYISLLDKYSSDRSVLETGGESQAIVKDRLVGSMMFNLIFIPGLAMIFGGFSYLQQQMNRVHVSTSTLLVFVSIFIIAMPTFFSQFIIQTYYADLTCVHSSIVNTTIAALHQLFCIHRSLTTQHNDPPPQPLPSGVKTAEIKRKY
jgi:hypothetical protein